MPEITWIYNRQTIIQPSTNVQPTVTPDGNISLHIVKVGPENIGEYTMRASNSEGSVEETAKLNIKCK